MKVEKTHTPPAFQPIALTITIESKEEYDAIYEMSHYNVSIPDLVDGNNCYRNEVAKFISALHIALLKK